MSDTDDTGSEQARARERAQERSRERAELREGTPVEPTPPRMQGAEGRSTVVHLLRHGEVRNPRGILYGRLPGFPLTEDGVLMAKAAARALAERDVAVVLSSPLERAVQTAEVVADTLGVDVHVDERLIEPTNRFEGLTFGVGDGSLRRPGHWQHLRNPFLPSWGEPYRQVAGRMLAAMAEARDTARDAPGGAAGGREAVCVSHQLPIWVTRRVIEGRKLWHRPDRRLCALASLTSVTYVGQRIVAVTYAEPAGAAARRHHVPGA